MKSDNKLIIVNILGDQALLKHWSLFKGDYHFLNRNLKSLDDDVWKEMRKSFHEIKEGSFILSGKIN